MKRVAALTIVFVGLALSLASCLGFVHGSGVIVTVPYDFDGFSRLEIGNAFDVEVVMAEDFRVLVTADDNLSEYINVSRSGNKLVIGMRPGFSYTGATMIARVEMPEMPLDDADVGVALVQILQGLTNRDMRADPDHRFEMIRDRVIRMKQGIERIDRANDAPRTIENRQAAVSGEM